MWKKSLVSFVLASAFGIFLTLLSCSSQFSTKPNGYGDGANRVGSNDIKTFSIDAIPAAGLINGQIITVPVPYGTAVSALTPTITLSEGSSVSPSSGTVKDFTNPVVYIVTADDGTTEDYTVTVVPHVYALGEVGPSGGRVFYVDGVGSAKFLPAGQTYMEAAPQNLLIGPAWSSVLSVHVTPDTAEEIGKGKVNTDYIIAQHGLNGTSAAKLCREQTFGGFTDWFLPSKGDLNQMNLNLQANGLGGFTYGNYWSSSEYSNPIAAWYQTFGNGTQGPNNKSGNAMIRCSRAF